MGRHRLLQDFQVELLTGSSVYSCHIHERLFDDLLKSYNSDNANCSTLPYSFYAELSMAVAAKKCVSDTVSVSFKLRDRADARFELPLSENEPVSRVDVKLDIDRSFMILNKINGMSVTAVDGALLVDCPALASMENLSRFDSFPCVDLIEFDSHFAGVNSKFGMALSVLRNVKVDIIGENAIADIDIVNLIGAAFSTGYLVPPPILDAMFANALNCICKLFNVNDLYYPESMQSLTYNLKLITSQLWSKIIRNNSEYKLQVTVSILDHSKSGCLANCSLVINCKDGTNAVLASAV